MDPMTILATVSSIANLLGGSGGGATKPQKRLHNYSGDLLMKFLSPGAFDAGGFGDNFFFNGPLQRQGIGINQFLSQPSPETKAFDTARPILEGMLTGTGPQFERDISLANSQGGRFGSANAILRGEALRNLFNMRNQTAQTLFSGANMAGNSTFDRLMQAQSQRLQLLSGLFGLGAQFGQNVGGGQNTLSALGNSGMDLATMLSIFHQGNGGGVRTAPNEPTDLS